MNSLTATEHRFTRCPVVTTALPEVAVQYVARAKPTVVIVDGDAVDPEWLCESLRATDAQRPLLLLTTSSPDAAGQVIDKCDSILLKPFAPNLLVGQVGV